MIGGVYAEHEKLQEENSCKSGYITSHLCTNNRTNLLHKVWDGSSVFNKARRQNQHPFSHVNSKLTKLER